MEEGMPAKEILVVPWSFQKAIMIRLPYFLELLVLDFFVEEVMGPVRL